MRRILSLEPEAVATLAKALLVAAVAFGLPISGGQTVALVGIVVPLLVLIGGLTRHVVTPVARVAEQATEVATEVVRQVGSAATGAVGEVTDTGLDIAKTAVSTVLGGKP